MRVGSRLLAAGLVCAAASCLVETDYGNTRFRCSEDSTCPAGQTCIAGYCDDGTTPDAAPPPPDAPPPDASPPSCDDLYGAATEYILCEQTATTCAFNVRTAGTTCNDACPGTCVAAYDNENGAGLECIPIGTDACDTPRQTEICICSR